MLASATDHVILNRGHSVTGGHSAQKGSAQYTAYRTTELRTQQSHVAYGVKCTQ